MAIAQKTKVTWKGKALCAAQIAAAKRQIHTEAEAILTDAVAICPFKEGVLRASGTVTDVINGSVISFNAPYARKQHEDLSLNHVDGQAKYLETPMDEHSGEVIKNVGAAIGAVKI